jgi:hypothetical protein
MAFRLYKVLMVRGLGAYRTSRLGNPHSSSIESRPSYHMSLFSNYTLSPCSDQQHISYHGTPPSYTHLCCAHCILHRAFGGRETGARRSATP